MNTRNYLQLQKPSCWPPHPPWEIKLAKEKENYINICLCSHLQNNFQATNSEAARKMKFESKNMHAQKKKKKVSVVLRLNAEAGRDTILESSEKRW